MASHTRPTFKNKVSFRKKNENDTWYRNGSNAHASIFDSQLPPDDYYEHGTMSDDIYTNARNAERPMRYTDDNIIRGRSNYNAPGTAQRNEDISRRYVRSEVITSPRTTNQNVYSKGKVSERYIGSDPYANNRRYNQSNTSYDHDSQHKDYEDTYSQTQSYNHTYQDSYGNPAIIKGVSKYLDPAPSEASGISNHYANSEVSGRSNHYTNSEASKMSKHYANSEASEISRHYAGSEASGISRHYAESEASGISKHYAESESTGISRKDGGISNFYRDMDFDSDDDMEPNLEPTIGDELARFQPQTNKKKSRFQVPEVSKLWFFNQNQDAYEAEHNEDVNAIQNEPKLEIRYNQSQPNVDREPDVDKELEANDEVVSVSGGDDVVFHPDPASPPKRGVDIESLVSLPSLIECFTPNPEKPKPVASFDESLKSKETSSPGRTATTTDSNSDDEDLNQCRSISYATTGSHSRSHKSSRSQRRKPSMWKQSIVFSCVFFFLSVVVVVVLLLVWMYTGFFDRSSETQDSQLTLDDNILTHKNPPTKAPTNMITDSDLSTNILSTLFPKNPTSSPTVVISNKPSPLISESPSMSPTVFSSTSPSATPTNTPSIQSSNVPSSSTIPSSMPVINLSPNPSQYHSEVPSNPPSLIHSVSPTENPTLNPTLNPTDSPTFKPSVFPSKAPSEFPSSLPSSSPSAKPSSSPSELPSNMPSSSPTRKPTEVPSRSLFPSSAPTASTITSFYVTGGRFQEFEIFNPYRTPLFVTELQAINPDNTDFLFHLGDFNDPETTECNIQSYKHYSSLLLNSPVSTFMIVGENDWPDCPNPVSSRIFWNTHFAAMEKAWPHHDLLIERMANQGSHFSFIKRRVIFFSIEMYTSAQETAGLSTIRKRNNLDWIRQRVSSRIDAFDAIVILGNDDTSADDNFFLDLDLEVLRYLQLPTLYIHRSNKNKNKMATNQFNTQYISVLQVASEVFPFVKVSVDVSKGSSPFSFAVGNN